MNIVSDVRNFHIACDVSVADTPTIPARIREDLRVRLIAEESEELLIALANRDFPKIADGIADLIYVCVGAALEYGIPLEKVWELVQQANMAKVDPGTGKVHRRADGKILKPHNWIAPDEAIQKLLIDMGAPS